MANDVPIRTSNPPNMPLATVPTISSPDDPQESAGDDSILRLPQESHIGYSNASFYARPGGPFAKLGEKLRMQYDDFLTPLENANAMIPDDDAVHNEILKRHRADFTKSRPRQVADGTRFSFWLVLLISTMIPYLTFNSICRCKHENLLNLTVNEPLKAL